MCNAALGVVLPEEMYELRLGISLGDDAKFSLERENSFPIIPWPGVIDPLVPGRLSLKPRAYVGPKSIEGMLAGGWTLGSRVGCDAPAVVSPDATKLGSPIVLKTPLRGRSSLLAGSFRTDISSLCVLA